MIPFYLINSKEARGKNCEMRLKLRLLKDMATFQTLQTWIGHNLTYYHNLNVLPHKLPPALLYNFSDICVVLRYLKRATTRYCHFFNIYFCFLNLTVGRGNPLQIVPC